MRTSSAELYRCPVHHTRLRVEGSEAAGVVESGTLVCPEGRVYPVERGVPDFTHPKELSEVEAKTKAEYDQVAERIYDAAVDWQFAALYEDEDRVREHMVDMLELEPQHRVLEVGCGTGRDSFRIARRLGEGGTLFLQDLSPAMVHTCRQKMADYHAEMSFSAELRYFISNASYLPFPDDFFDAVFHFGGFNKFGDLDLAAREFARVTKQGGKILYGDESVAPWLRDTEFGGIVTTNNPLFRCELPLKTVPECARDVTLRWIMGNCFYLLAFTKGDGPPRLNLDLAHAGRRGGTMRTRYFGALEGVTLETQGLAWEAVRKSGVSMHAWLDALVRERAEAELGGGS